VAWLTSSFGLSLSLGAFLAGLIVSDSEYRHEAIGDILPFQDIFTSFFFVSIGMLLNTGFVFENPLTVLSIATGIIALKAVMAGSTTLILGMPLRTAVLGGVALAQVGEFSFVIAKGGVENGIVSNYHYQLFLAVSLLTMAATPSMVSLSPWLASLLNRLPFPAKIKRGFQTSEEKAKHVLKDHVIIVGFGPCGQYLARSIKASGVPYAILEMNPDTVRTQRLAGEPIYFGDAAHTPVLHHVSLENARAVAILINDFFATQQIVEQIRKLNPNVYILARTRYMQQVISIYHCGADYAIPDEFGSAIEIFTNILRTCEVGNEKIDKIVDEIRQERYDAVQSYQKERVPLHALHLRVGEAAADVVKVE
jgi:CPA2 family monovalent cation:H+ antiporter-2